MSLRFPEDFYPRMARMLTNGNFIRVHSCHSWTILFLLILLPRLAAAQSTQPVLRVAADPNNLPFSNDRGEGFENKIAQLVAKEMGATLQYDWRAQRRGFFRDSLKSGEADLVIGCPHDFDKALTTEPYYRSSYVFVWKDDRKLDIKSFDDASLKKLKIGVPVIGGNNDTPPALALARRGIVDNVVGFSIYSDYREPNPSARIIEAAAKGDIDVAIVWGPLGGYFATREPVKLHVETVPAPAEQRGMPYAFDISMGVKKSNKDLCDKLNGVIAAKHTEIDKILDEYGVPRVKS
jgi:mxaJ protein